MSAAAERYVLDWSRGCLDPNVMRSARTLMTVIAQRIPEGETTTPLIGMDALADLARCARRTVVTQLRLLVELGEVQVIDGGQGRRGQRYTLVHLDGARPMTPAPLPLVGAAAPPRASKPRTRPASSTPTLFDLPAPATSGDQRAINLCNQITSRLRNLCNQITSWLRDLVQPVISDHKLPQPVISKRSESEEPVISDHKLAAELVISVGAHQLDRARDVRTTTTTRTTTAREPPTAEAPPLHPWHAWCGRVCVPKSQHAEFLQRLGRRPGETDAALDARAFACYAAELATIPADQPIAVATEFKFWRSRFATMLTAAAPATLRRGGVQIDRDVWTDILRAIEVKVDRHAFFTWFVPIELVEDRGAVIVIAGPAPKGDLIADWIEKHYGDVVHQAVETVRPGARIEFRRQSQRTG